LNIKTKKEMFMENTVTFGKRLVPVEQIALIEPFDPLANPKMQSGRPFKARVVLLNRDSILSEESPATFAEKHGFRFLPEDGVYTNPALQFGVEVFEPAGDFQPTKRYLSRLGWRDLDGNTHSKLLLTEPDDVLAIVVRGDKGEAANEGSAADPSPLPQTRSSGRRRSRRQAPRAALAQG
jgi:hypothetical protein